MNPLDLFNPANFNPLDPQQLAGQANPSRLLAAAASLPGGATALVFLLFWAPVGPGIPAGVILARHVHLNPLLTFGLYTLSDLLGALVCHPLFTLCRRAGRRVAALRWIGTRLVKVAMLGTPLPRTVDAGPVGGTAPALFRVGTVGFGVDIYTAGMLVGGLPIPRIAGWLAAIAGDLVWFAILLGTSLAAAAVVNDDRAVGLIVLLAMVIIPQVARRIFPALREPVPAAPPAARRAPPVQLPDHLERSLPPAGGNPPAATTNGQATGGGERQPRSGRGPRRGGGQARAASPAPPRTGRATSPRARNAP